MKDKIIEVRYKGKIVKVYDFLSTRTLGKDIIQRGYQEVKTFKFIPLGLCEKVSDRNELDKLSDKEILDNLDIFNQRELRYLLKVRLKGGEKSGNCKH